MRTDGMGPPLVAMPWEQDDPEPISRPATAEHSAVQPDDEHRDEPLPPPSEPMAVARAIVAALYANDARLLLRSRSGDFYRWDGRCWPEAESRGIRGAVYAFLEHATYANKDGIPVPWGADPTQGG